MCQTRQLVCSWETVLTIFADGTEMWEGAISSLRSHTAVWGLLAVGWDYVKRLWSETARRAKSTSEAWLGQHVGRVWEGTATRCWRSRSEIDPGWRAISRGLIPNNACVLLWRYPHRNNAAQFPLSSFHAYFLKSHCFDTTEVFWVQDDALFITEWEGVWRTPVATLAWRCPGTPISSDTWYSPLCGGPPLGGHNIPSVFWGVDQSLSFKLACPAWHASLW